MKIIDVKVYCSKQKDKREFRWRDGLKRYSDGTSALIQIVTDVGIEGFASGRNAEYVGALAKKYFKDLLIGEDPLNRERLYHKMLEIDRLEYMAPIYTGIVDNALWDIASKKAQIPLYQLIGGYRDKALAYASTPTYETTDEFLEVADQCLAKGYKGIKLHAWGDARRDARLCQALRKHVGDDIYLMYDGSGAFDYLDALYLGRALQEAGYYWYEEPMREYSISAYRKLSDNLDIPLLVGENSAGSYFNMADFLAFGQGDLVRISAGLKGGITGALKIAHLAESFNLRAEVHGGGDLHLHLICGIRNTSFYENFVWGLPMKEARQIGSDGYVHVSGTPGIRNNIDLEKVRMQAYASFSVLD